MYSQVFQPASCDGCGLQTCSNHCHSATSSLHSPTPPTTDQLQHVDLAMQVSTVPHAFSYLLASCCPGSDAGASALAGRAWLHVTVPLVEVDVGGLEVVVTVRRSLASYTGRGLLDRGLTAATPQAPGATPSQTTVWLVTELDKSPPVQSPRLTRAVNGLRAAFEFDANLGPAGLAGVAGVLGVVPSDVVTWFERAPVRACWNRWTSSRSQKQRTKPRSTAPRW